MAVTEGFMMEPDLHIGDFLSRLTFHSRGPHCGVGRVLTEDT